MWLIRAGCPYLDDDLRGGGGGGGGGGGLGEYDYDDDDEYDDSDLWVMWVIGGVGWGVVGGGGAWDGVGQTRQCETPGLVVFWCLNVSIPRVQQSVQPCVPCVCDTPAGAAARTSRCPRRRPAAATGGSWRGCGERGAWGLWGCACVGAAVAAGRGWVGSCPSPRPCC